VNIAVENEDKVHMVKYDENNIKELILFNNYKGNGDIYLSCKNFTKEGLDCKHGNYEIKKYEDVKLYNVFNELHKKIAQGYMDFISKFGDGAEKIEDFEFRGLENILSSEPEFSLYSSDARRNDFDEKNEQEFNKVTIKRKEDSYLLDFNDYQKEEVRVRNNSIRFHMDRPSLKHYGIDMINIIHDLYNDCKDLKNIDYDEMFKIQQEKFKAIQKINEDNECR
jgi:hypothetical protein